MENTNAHVQWVNQNKPRRQIFGRHFGAGEAVLPKAEWDGANTVSEWKLCLEHGAKEGAGAERRSEMSGPEMS